MPGDMLLQLAALMILGIGATWLAAFLRIPSILLLLLAGFLAGPVSGFLHPDALFGDVLLPLVSLSVAIILFEGGLQLKVRNIRETRKAVLGLVLLGSVITFCLTSLLARLVLKLDWSLSVLIGAILVVTGPTVIMPLLRIIRPERRIGAVLRWEGIVNDPLGATLAFIVFEWIQTGKGAEALPAHVGLLMLALGAGALAGVAGAALLLILLRHYWVPDYLQSAMALMTALAVYTLSNLVAPESGLLGVTVMGIVLANQRQVNLHHLTAFAEDLRVLLIAFLFIALSARIELAVFSEVGLEVVLFLVLSILLIRPLAVFLSTAGCGLSTREKAMLSWMAPRGIVAAAVASVFALHLREQGWEGSEKLLPVVFLVIVGTVLVYGTTARPLARRLGLAPRNRDGVLFVGANALVRALAGLLKQEDVASVLITDIEADQQTAQAEGLDAHYCQIPSRRALEELNLGSVGNLVVFTSNDGLNLLAMLQWEEYFDRRRVCHLPLPSEASTLQAGESYTLHGRLLGHPPLPYEQLQNLQRAGAEITKLTWPPPAGAKVYPFFHLDNHRRLHVCTGDGPGPSKGQTVLALVHRPIS